MNLGRRVDDMIERKREGVKLFHQAPTARELRKLFLGVADGHSRHLSDAFRQCGEPIYEGREETHGETLVASTDALGLLWIKKDIDVTSDHHLPIAAEPAFE